LPVDAQSIEASNTLTIRFEPSGTHIKDGQLKIRLDFYPTENSKSYGYYLHWVVDTDSPEYLAGYLGKIDKEGNPVDIADYEHWLDSLSHKWQLNPCLSHFVKVPSDIDKSELDAWVKQTFTASVTDTIDDAMIQDNSAHLISPYMRDKCTLQTEKLNLDESQKTALYDSVNITLTDYKVDATDTTGTIERVEPKSIDVGSAAINRSLYQSLYRSSDGRYRTAIEYSNPANADGEIDTVQGYFDTADENNIVRFGTFTAGGSDSFTCHDGEQYGAVTTRSTVTCSGLTMAVSTGEYIGVDSGAAVPLYIDLGSSGGGGHYYIVGTYCDASDSGTFSFLANYITSLYGTGTESGGGVTFVPKVLWLN
jgi:hypothetical protein